jgi:molecular chaperone GrpE
MEKEKKEKSKINKEEEQNQQEPASEGESENKDQTMVALTFDEYDALEKEIASLRDDLENHKDGWLRTRADFENYKKRVLRDASRSHQDAMTNIVKVFLGVADDLERALKNKPDAKHIKNWTDGIELIQQKLLTQMNNLGVERMETRPGDEFDPNFHEAITQEENPDYEDGQIIEVVQPGYKISDRIIRPAMVRVAR